MEVQKKLHEQLEVWFQLRQNEKTNVSLYSFFCRFLMFWFLSDDVGLNAMQVQRTLQLQIEEQGRYLQMMIEKQQQKMQEKKIGSSSGSSSMPEADNTSAPSTNLSQKLQSGSSSTLDQSGSFSGATKKRVRED